MWHGFGHRFSRKVARILFRNLARISRGVFFSPLFPTDPRQMPATPKIPKSTPSLEAFSQWFLWVLDLGMHRCFWMSLSLRRSTNLKLVATQPRAHRPSELRNVHAKSKIIWEFSGTMEKQKNLAPHPCPIDSEVFFCFSGFPLAVLGQKRNGCPCTH